MSGGFGFFAFVVGIYAFFFTTIGSLAWNWSFGFCIGLILLCVICYYFELRFAQKVVHMHTTATKEKS